MLDSGCVWSATSTWTLEPGRANMTARADDVTRPRRLTTSPIGGRTMAAPRYHIGSFVDSKGQRYEMLGLKTHVRKDGVPIYLVRWRSHCAECNKPFEFTFTINEWKYPNRRCQTHKNPGKRVQPWRA